MSDQTANVLWEEEKTRASPLSLSTPWFIRGEGDRQEGPFLLMQLQDKLLTGAITPETHLWQKGMTGWLPLRQVQALEFLWKLDSDVSALETGVPVAPPLLEGEPQAVRSSLQDEVFSAASALPTPRPASTPPTLASPAEFSNFLFADDLANREPPTQIANAEMLPFQVRSKSNPPSVPPVIFHKEDFTLVTAESPFVEAPKRRRVPIWAWGVGAFVVVLSSILLVALH